MVKHQSEGFGKAVFSGVFFQSQLKGNFRGEFENAVFPTEQMWVLDNTVKEFQEWGGIGDGTSVGCVKLWEDQSRRDGWRLRTPRLICMVSVPNCNQEHNETNPSDSEQVDTEVWSVGG